MHIAIRVPKAHDVEQTRELVTDRLHRVLGRFTGRIRQVLASVSEERQRHGKPRATCAVAVHLSDGGTIHVDSRGTRLVPAVSRAMERLGTAVSHDPRLGARRPQR